MAETSPINPALKNLYFSMLETKTNEEMKLHGLNYGKLTEMLFIISEKKKCQQLRFSNKEFDYKKDEVQLTTEELKGFTDSISYDLEKELPKIKSLFVKMDFVNQMIFITKNNLDGTISETKF